MIRPFALYVFKNCKTKVRNQFKKKLKIVKSSCGGILWKICWKWSIHGTLCKLYTRTWGCSSVYDAWYNKV